MGSKVIKPAEYQVIKQLTELDATPRAIGRAVKRGVATVNLIRQSKDFADYRRLQAYTHRNTPQTRQMARQKGSPAEVTSTASLMDLLQTLKAQIDEMNIKLDRALEEI